jgi:hypothetical protein
MSCFYDYGPLTRTCSTLKFIMLILSDLGENTEALTNFSSISSIEFSHALVLYYLHSKI